MNDYHDKLKSLKSILNKTRKTEDEPKTDIYQDARLNYENKIIEEKKLKYDANELKNKICMNYIDKDIFSLFLNSFLSMLEMQFKEYGHNLSEDLNSEVINIIMKDDEELIEKLSYYLFINSLRKQELDTTNDHVFKLLQNDNINTYEYISSMEKVYYNDMERS